MAFTIDATDARSIRAIELAATAGGWAKIRSKDGRKAYGIPSASLPGRLYIVTADSCDCADARQHVCEHRRAVKLYSELVKAQQPRPSHRSPLRLVVEDDNVVNWERPARP